MVLKIGIGITTYAAIADAACGRAVFDAYVAVSPRIVPNQVRVWSSKYPVETADDFAAHWVTRAPYTTREGRHGPSIEKGEMLIGAEWRRTGSLSGSGSVTVRPENDPQRENTILIEHNYAARIDWAALLERLVAITEPAYAMLHVFDDKQRRPDGGLECFDGPFAGEAHFVNWKSNLGEWRKPDSRDHAERRRYRFLPELSWMNFLGPQFDGQYDPGYLASHAKHVRHMENGILFRVTEAIADIESEPTAFEAARREVRAAFKPGFFRISTAPH